MLILQALSAVAKCPTLLVTAYYGTHLGEKLDLLPHLLSLLSAGTASNKRHGTPSPSPID
jgi:hypothetical protein